MAERYGNLLILGYYRGERSRLYANVRCDCGAEKAVRFDGIKSGTVVSCGCFRLKQVTAAAMRHGLADSPEYRVWDAMIQRCSTPGAGEFHNYGARGIAVCERWQDFGNFIEDMGRRPPGMTLERKDNDAGYGPDNCVWADWFTQNANRRNNRRVVYEGEEMIVAEACRRSGVRPASVHRRARRRKISHQQAFDDLLSGNWEINQTGITKAMLGNSDHAPLPQ